MTPPAKRAIFDLRVVLHDDRVVITLFGELDHAAAGRLRTAADEAWQTQPAGIVVDIAALTFCDSAGIPALLYVRKGCEQRGVPLALAGHSPRTERLLRITGLQARFESFTSVGEALSAGLRGHSHLSLRDNHV